MRFGTDGEWLPVVAGTRFGTGEVAAVWTRAVANVTAWFEKN